MIDLHTHSIFSDGELHPSELVRQAELAGVEVLALTDHDTVDGLPAFMDGEASLERVAGIEISVECTTGAFHLVGLFIDPAAEAMQVAIRKVKKFRRERNMILMERLAEFAGRAVAIEELCPGGCDNMGKPHIARWLVENGYAESIEHCFRTIMGRGQKITAPKFRLSFEEACGAIHGSGGVAIIAHPKTLNLSPEKERFFFEDLRSRGLDGIEVYSSEHTVQDIRRYLQHAVELDMPISAGSDFHGEGLKDVRLGVGKGLFAAPVQIYTELCEYRERMGR